VDEKKRLTVPGDRSVAKYDEHRIGDQRRVMSKTQACARAHADLSQTRFALVSRRRCVGGSELLSTNGVLSCVSHGGRGDRDTWAINATTFAGEPLLGDITPGFEFEFDDCSFFEQWDCFCSP
jgi:hypothetical protein